MRTIRNLIVLDEIYTDLQLQVAQYIISQIILPDVETI